MTTKVKTMTDPLSLFMAEVMKGKDAYPLPLIATSIDLSVLTGLVVVTMKRIFRNVEKRPIEAVMTFPVPIHAAVFALEANIDGRHVKAVAQSKLEARQTYERAVESGKAAVLHEEVLRGIHTLSVANLRPDAEVEVILKWVTTPNLINGRGELRIPLTVGDVYGCSGLSDVDDLTHAASPLKSAILTVSRADIPFEIAGKSALEGPFNVALNRPIDLTFPRWKSSALHGTAADGRSVDVFLEPSPVLSGARAAVAVMFDYSGSMSEPFSGVRGKANKHDVAAMVVRSVAGGMAYGDHLDLWQFDTQASRVGQLDQFDDRSIMTLLNMISGPRDGTEIGRCIEQVASGTETRDILLITDGKSYALDFQALLKLGKRISVLLIGEDSLEARVGHLAALTGGQLFIVTERNLDDIAAAMDLALRSPFQPASYEATGEETLQAQRCGMSINATWHRGAKSAQDEEARAIGAFSAFAAIQALDEEQGAKWAEAEGLATHLTSLILVDEVGEAVKTLPALRKVPLASPMSLAPDTYFSADMSITADLAINAPRVSASIIMHNIRKPAPPRRLQKSFEYQEVSDAIARLSALIDWDNHPSEILNYDLNFINLEAHELIDILQMMLEDVADSLGMAPISLALGLAAHVGQGRSRSAMRIARKLLQGLDDEVLRTLFSQLRII